MLAIYIQDQLALLQAKESCPSRSPGAIRRYPSLNRVIVGLRVFFDPESLVGNMEVRIPGGMASTTAMLSIMYPARKEKVDDSGFLRTPDRLLGLWGLYVLKLEFCETMIGTYGPYNSSGSATASIRACHYRTCCSTTLHNSK